MASILIIKPSSLGDVVHALPAVAAIKAARPEWRLHWLVNPEWAPLLAGNPCLEPVNGVIHFPRSEFRGVAGWPRLFRWLKELRAAGHEFDGILDFQGLLRSALIARWFRPRWIAGLSDAREGAGLFYTRRAQVRADVHAARRYLRLAGLAVENPALADLPAAQLDFPLPPGDPLPEFNPLENEPYLVLHPFSRGQDKSLSAAQVGLLCAALVPRRVVLAGRCAPEVEAALHLPSNATSLLNRTTLPQLIGLLRGAEFTISVDSGPMHIAAALGPAVLGIHTWSNPALVGPLHPQARVWKGGQLFTAAECQAPGWTCPPGNRTPTDAELQTIADYCTDLPRKV